MLNKWNLTFDNLRWILEFLISEEIGKQKGDEQEVDDEEESAPAKCSTSTNDAHLVSKRFITLPNLMISPNAQISQVACF